MHARAQPLDIAASKATMLKIRYLRQTKHQKFAYSCTLRPTWSCQIECPVIHSTTGAMMGTRKIESLNLSRRVGRGMNSIHFLTDMHSIQFLDPQDNDIFNLTCFFFCFCFDFFATAVKVTHGRPTKAWPWSLMRSRWAR